MSSNPRPVQWHLTEPEQIILLQVVLNPQPPSAALQNAQADGDRVFGPVTPVRQGRGGRWGRWGRS